MVGFILGVLITTVVAWIVVQYFRQNLRLLEEEKHRLEQQRTLVLEFMHNLVEGVGGESRKQDLHIRILHAAVLGTSAVSGCVFVPQGDKVLRSVAVEGLFPPQNPTCPESDGGLSTRAEFIQRTMEPQEIPYGTGLIGEVAASGKAVLVNDAEQDKRIVQNPEPVLRVRAMMVVPMFFRKRFLGIIALANPADGMGFSETDFSLVSSLAEQAALAIHNVDQLHLQMERQRLDIDLSLAANIQGMLLPATLPDLPGLELAAAYQTAQQVGGDMYNVLELPDGKIGVAIADVSGKGIAASLLMAICQTSLLHLARDGKDPFEVLVRMNEEILQEIRADMFVTMIYAIVDRKAQSIRLARAGHELPVLFSLPQGGEPLSCRTIASEGMALGMVPDELFSSTLEVIDIPFHPGDILAFYTDGITERTNPDGVEFATSRLIDVVREHYREKVGDLKSTLLSAVESFSGNTPPADDMTLLILKGVPIGDSRES